MLHDSIVTLKIRICKFFGILNLGINSMVCVLVRKVQKLKNIENQNFFWKSPEISVFPHKKKLTNLKAAACTIFREDANIWWICASANKCTDVIMSQISNLMQKTLLFENLSKIPHNILSSLIAYQFKFLFHFACDIDAFLAYGFNSV